MGRTEPEVLIVDDDGDYSAYIAELLRRAGITPRAVPDGLRAISEARHRPPALVLLDLSLPKVDGSSLVTIFRHQLRIPVIIVSGRSSLHEIVSNLEQGADDYVVKPVRGEELIARVHAVLRRVNEAPSDRAPDDETCTFRDLVIDVGSKQVTLRGDQVRLTPREFNLLVHLARHPGRTFTRQEILRDVWHSTRATSAASTVNEHIRRLRLKLEVDPTHPRHIVTVAGFGYRFDADEVAERAEDDRAVVSNVA